jgi:hypothetical protein
VTEKIPQTGYNGKIPVAAIISLEREIAGLTHGVASLVLHIRDGKLARYETEKRTSHLPDNLAGGNNEPSCR